MRLYEVINSKIFNLGFEQKKSILDGRYELVAKAGPMLYHPSKMITTSEQFRIEAFKKRVLVGWVNFEPKGDHLEAMDLFVNKNHRQKGIASEMYIFAKELGNSIKQSNKQTSMGKLFWNKDHT
jgi:hypothetical protein